jgi:hypothetical protein
MKERESQVRRARGQQYSTCYLDRRATPQPFNRGCADLTRAHCLLSASKGVSVQMTACQQPRRLEEELCREQQAWLAGPMKITYRDRSAGADLGRRARGAHVLISEASMDA